MYAISADRTLGSDPAELIPDPDAKFVRLLAAHAFEAVEGLRSITQLGAALSVGAARQLALQRNALRERNFINHDTRVCVASPGRMRLCRLLPSVAEAAVVLHTERKAHVVALRLEWVRGRWRASEVHIL